MAGVSEYKLRVGGQRPGPGPGTGKHKYPLHGKLCSKLLAQVANKNTKFTFMETGRLRFS